MTFLFRFACVLSLVLVVSAIDLSHTQSPQAPDRNPYFTFVQAVGADLGLMPYKLLDYNSVERCIRFSAHFTEKFVQFIDPPSQEELNKSYGCGYERYCDPRENAVKNSFRPGLIERPVFIDPNGVVRLRILGKMDGARKILYLEPAAFAAFDAFNGWGVFSISFGWNVSFLHGYETTFDEKHLKWARNLLSGGIRIVRRGELKYYGVAFLGEWST